MQRTAHTCNSICTRTMRGEKLPVLIYAIAGLQLKTMCLFKKAGCRLCDGLVLVRGVTASRRLRRVAHTENVIPMDNMREHEEGWHPAGFQT